MRNIFRRLKINTLFSLAMFAMLFVFANTTAQTMAANAATEKVQSDKAHTTVTGKVIDALTGKPLAAAQINVIHKGFSAITDDKGEFSIKCDSKLDLLQVSTYGYDRRQIPLQGRSVITVKLFSAAFKDQYDQISLPTGSTDKLFLVNSAREITSDSKSFTADNVIANELSGQVWGISRSAVEGNGSSLFVRGVNSLFANAQPLFVVDGVIWDNYQEYFSTHVGYYSNPLDAIDGLDIENITVLKDGASMYGSRGANGVIVINTKRSNTMVTRISVNASTSYVESPSSLPMMSGESFRLYANDMLASSRDFHGTSSYLDFSTVSFLVTDPSNISYDEYHNVTDWTKSVYQSGINQNYMINAQGGDDKAMYYFSLGYTSDQGVVKTTSLERLNARFNADFNLSKNFNMGLNIGFTRNERRMIDDGINIFSSPSWMAAVKAPFLSPFAYTNVGDQTLNWAHTDIFGVGNPEAMINASINSLKKYRFNLSFHPKYKLTPEITIGDQFDYSLYKTTEGHFVPMNFTAPMFIQDKGYSQNRISSLVSRNMGIFNNFHIDYDKNFDKIHNLSVVAGSRYIRSYYEYDYIEEHNSGSNNNTTITGSYDFLDVFGENNHHNSISNYLNADYTYDNRYFLKLQASMDASSRFGRQTEGGIRLFGLGWGLFPSVQGAWLLSNESSFKDLSAISLLKLRGGWGLTGNDGIPDYQTRTYFVTERFHKLANGIVLGNLANEGVQWETNSKFNAGLDLGLADDRIMLNLDVFHSNISNMLVLRSLPVYTGLKSFWDNGGNMTNQGFEANLDFKILNLKSVQWEASVSAGHYTNQIKQLVDGDFLLNVFDGQIKTAVGESFGDFYGYKTSGVFATQAQADAANLKQLMADGTVAQFNAGDLIFQDLNADGIIDANDKTVLGNFNPELYGNMQTKVSFGRLSLNAVFTYSYGGEVYNYYRSKLEDGMSFNNQTNSLLSRWRTEGQITSIPKASYLDPMGNSRFSDRWIEDGSYVKLKNLSVNYQIPFKSDYIESVNVWASADNLYTWTRYLGMDPEFSVSNSQYGQGVDAGLLPLTRTYTMGIKVNL